MYMYYQLMYFSYLQRFNVFIDLLALYIISLNNNSFPFLSDSHILWIMHLTVVKLCSITSPSCDIFQHSCIAHDFHRVLSISCLLFIKSCDKTFFNKKQIGVCQIIPKYYTFILNPKCTYMGNFHNYKTALGRCVYIIRVSRCTTYLSYYCICK